MDDDAILMAEGRGNMASDESEDIASRQAPITSTPGVIEPELIAVPSLAASIAWHEQRLARLQMEDDWTAHDELKTREASVAWIPAYEEISRDILIASRIVAEIRQGLVELGLLDSSPKVEDSTGVAELDIALLELEQALVVHEEFPDPDHRRTFHQALDLVRAFEGLRGQWVVDEVHLVAERVAEWDPEISDVTLDEWELICPDIPTIDGLRDWNDISDEAWEEGWVFDSTMLVEECRKVLVGLVDLIVTRSSRA